MKNFIRKSIPLVLFVLIISTSGLSQNVPPKTGKEAGSSAQEATPKKVWIQGYYKRTTAGSYQWIDGYYVTPHNGQVWVPSHWSFVKGNWVFVPGRVKNIG